MSNGMENVIHITTTNIEITAFAYSNIPENKEITRSWLKTEAYENF